MATPDPLGCANRLLKILVPANIAEDVFRENNICLNRIEIFLSNEGDFFPNSDCRVCLLTGKTHNILKAITFITLKICDLLTGQSTERPDNHKRLFERILVINIVVPQCSVKNIFRKNDRYREEIIESSGCIITASQLSSEADERERRLNIAGTATGITVVVSMILRDIQPYSSADYYKNISYAHKQLPLPPPPPVLERNINHQDWERSTVLKFLPSGVDSSPKLYKLTREAINPLLRQLYSESILSEASYTFRVLQNRNLLSEAFVILIKDYFPGVLKNTENVDNFEVHLPTQNDHVAPALDVNPAAVSDMSDGSPMPSNRFGMPIFASKNDSTRDRCSCF